MLDLVTAYSEVLVGREPDLAALRDALKSTRSAEPSTVLVGGEAGVGKTRLVEEFRRGLAGDQVRVLTGQCLELGEEGLPFAPFAGAVRDLVRAEGTSVLDGHERELAQLLPELGPPAPQRGLLFEAVGALLGRLSAEQPLVLVIEDLHWADRSTRDLIGFLVRSARLPRLLLIATYRTDELHRGHPLRPFLAELDRVRGVRRHELDRLDRDGTAEMLTHLLGAEPDPGVVDTVNERTQGIPFFIEQFAASADPACGDIPGSLRDLLLSRVDQLPEPAQRVLRVAAVGGTRFGHELLSRVAGMPEADLESSMRVVVAAQLVVVLDAADDDGVYEFRHALVREAVHDDLLPGEHARLHARYARALEAEPHLVGLGRSAAEIAHHWHAARDHPRALVTAKVAADEAGHRFAWAEQARLLDRVLELWEDVPDAATQLGLDHLDLLEEAALAAIESGDHMRAFSLTRAALSDLDAEAEPLRAGRLLVRRAKLLRTAGKSDGRAECDEAFRLLRGAPYSTDRVRLLADLAHILAAIDRDRAVEVAEVAKADATEQGDVDALVAAEMAYGLACAGRIPPTEALPTIRAAIAQAREAADLPSLTRGLVNLSDQLYETGDYEASAAAAAEGLPDAHRVGISRTIGVYLMANYAEALIALGRWDEADARLAEAARLDPPNTLALHWLRLRSRLRLARGRDDAEALVSRSLSFLSRPFLVTEVRLAIHELRLLSALTTATPQAAADLARASLTEPAMGTLPRYTWAILANAARAANRAGDKALAEEIAARAATLPRRFPAERAYAAQTEALLTGGEPAWRAAVEAWRTDGHPHELATALLDLAETLAADRTTARTAPLIPAPRPAALTATSPAPPSPATVTAGPAPSPAPVIAGQASSAAVSAGPASSSAPVTAGRASSSAPMSAGPAPSSAASGLAPSSAAPGLAPSFAAAAVAGAQTGVAELIAEAMAIAGALGATPLVEAAETLARRLGIRAAAEPATAGTEILTPREREVLRLVAEGHSNNRIAADLYISPKTASVHVSRIIAKLEVSNRVEAAAVAHRLGLLAD
ncbi:helix-turn-helix transcriptional regulator [Paractinoplanes atraurantiacus]|uniref:Regulatory protein, luxR family n=1 Tax=Paractinoplanes atraurantiacus TaxID=1036182 RepID=A0A285HF56_9ACTN|nr:AAA family ATPase [Actinoplanes atraurantiacus]SNY33341.1 regulatory protein, luxR family [Actinoplanes atraurantiacus]